MAKHTFLLSRNAMETKLITVFLPIIKFAEIFKMASKMAAENRKFKISDCGADKTEISSAEQNFLWSRNALETRFPIQYFALLPNLQRYSRWRPRWQLETDNLMSSTICQTKQKFQVLSIHFYGQGMHWSKVNYNMLPHYKICRYTILSVQIFTFSQAKMKSLPVLYN